jgi:hypothetical protein
MVHVRRDAVHRLRSVQGDRRHLTAAVDRYEVHGGIMRAGAKAARALARRG